MNSGSHNLRRLIVLSYGAPKITEDNWERLHDEGWEWHANIEAADYETAHEFIRALHAAYDRGNVSVGAPWDIDRNAPNDGSASLCGVYVRDIKRLVFSLHRDLARWEGLTEEQLDEL